MKKRTHGGKKPEVDPCKKCFAKCCRYFALQIDTPRSRADFEKVRWYIAHKKVTVFVEKRKWFLDVDNDCRYVTADHRCGIYERRPLICRDHSPYDCERKTDQFDHEMAFSSIQELDAFIEKRFRKKKRKKA